MKVLIFNYDFTYNTSTIRSLMYTRKVKLYANTQWHEICHIYDNCYDTGKITHLDDRYDIL